jgi:hypothetical protein
VGRHGREVFTTKLQRRTLLACDGGCALAARLGGMASILASARAPALA